MRLTRSLSQAIATLPIRIKIGGAFALLALLLFSAVGVISGRTARHSVEMDAGSAMLQLASRVSVNLDIGLYERFREVQNMAALEPVLASSLDAGNWRAVIGQLQKSFAHYAWIGVADEHGQVRAGTDGLLEGANVSMRPWFVQGLRRAYAGDVHEALLLAKLLPQPADGGRLRLIDVAAPIRHGTDVVGVLGAHIDWRWVEQRRQLAMRTLDPAQLTEVIVVGRDGTQLLRSASSETITLANDALDRVKQQGHSIETWSDGQRYLTAAAHGAGFEDYPGLGWTVVARQPLDIALQPARHLQKQIWALGLLGAALFGALGWWLAGRLTAPLRKVALDARAIVDTRAHEVGGRQSRDEVVQLSGALGSLVRQLRQREVELVELTGTLEQRVDQRTQSLQQTNADLSSFSRSVAHDLKAPVASIAMALDLILERDAGQLSTSSSELLKKLAVECRRLGTLVDEMMALALVEQQPLKTSVISMHDLVQTVETNLRNDIAVGIAAGTPTTQLVVDRLVDVEGDALLMRQVWQNLLSNAFKFSARSSTPMIVVASEATGSEVVYSVSDNGVGFNASQVDRLFGVFARLHHASDFPGTGVGLSIVKRIVHRHGGRVWATSVKDQGSSFYFAVPKARTE